MTLVRVLHTLALGLWAGMAAFFNGCVALKIFAYFRALAEQPTPGLSLADSEVATRMAGDLIATIFPVYFLLQCVLGLIAAATAVRLAKGGSTADRWKARLLVAACLIVWVHVGTLYRQSREIRRQQYAALDAGRTNEAQALRKQFFALHGPSLVIDFSTTALVLVALGLNGLGAAARGGEDQKPSQ